MAESLSFENLKGEYEKILGIIQRGTDEVKSLNKENEEIEAGPAKARAEYDACIDAGDRKAANETLDKLAAAQKKVSDAPDNYVELRVAILNLYKRQKELVQKIGRLTTEERERWETIPAQLEENFKKAVLLAKQIETVSGMIDKLAKKLPPKKE